MSEGHADEQYYQEQVSHTSFNQLRNWVRKQMEAELNHRLLTNEKLSDEEEDIEQIVQVSSVSQEVFNKLRAVSS